MNARIFERAVDLAEERQHMLISTANKSGMPHIASVGSIRSVAKHRLALGDWYCPATMFNIQENAQVSMIVWDIATDTGYQLLGEVEAVRPTDELTGDPLEKELIIRVNSVLTFSHAYHTDVEISDAHTAVLSPAKEEKADELDKNALAQSEEWRESYLFLK